MNKKIRNKMKKRSPPNSILMAFWPNWDSLGSYYTKSKWPKCHHSVGVKQPQGNWNSHGIYYTKWKSAKMPFFSRYKKSQGNSNFHGALKTKRIQVTICKSNVRYFLHWLFPNWVESHKVLVFPSTNKIKSDDNIISVSDDSKIFKGQFWFSGQVATHVSPDLFTCLCFRTNRE